MSMTFDNIPDGASVYLDANVIICDFTRMSRDCSRLLDRCRDEELYGVVSTVTAAEVCHRTMCEEARQKTGKRTLNASYLKKQPAIVRQLTEYAKAVVEILEASSLTVIEVTQEDVLRSQQIRDRYGLLTNDSIIAHIVLDWGIPAIATNDPDFDDIAGIQVFKPSDLTK